jgi:hypothetical protein
VLLRNAIVKRARLLRGLRARRHQSRPRAAPSRITHSDLGKIETDQDRPGLGGNPLDLGPIGESRCLVESRPLVAFHISGWTITVLRAVMSTATQPQNLGSLHAPREEVAISDTKIRPLGAQGVRARGLASREWLLPAPARDAPLLAMGIRSANPISAPSRIFRFPLKTCNLAARIVYAGDENLLDQSLDAYGTYASRHRYNSSRSFQGPALKAESPQVSSKRSV